MHVAACRKNCGAIDFFFLSFRFIFCSLCYFDACYFCFFSLCVCVLVGWLFGWLVDWLIGIAQNPKQVSKNCMTLVDFYFVVWHSSVFCYLKQIAKLHRQSSCHIVFEHMGRKTMVKTCEQNFVERVAKISVS